VVQHQGRADEVRPSLHRWRLVLEARAMKRASVPLARSSLARSCACQRAIPLYKGGGTGTAARAILRPRGTVKLLTFEPQHREPAPPDGVLRKSWRVGRRTVTVT
jgi:hypothetical protein